jgi:hypothetical protein
MYRNAISYGVMVVSSLVVGCEASSTSPLLLGKYYSLKYFAEYGYFSTHQITSQRCSGFLPVVHPISSDRCLSLRSLPLRGSHYLTNTGVALGVNRRPYFTVHSRVSITEQPGCRLLNRKFFHRTVGLDLKAPVPTARAAGCWAQRAQAAFDGGWYTLAGWGGMPPAVACTLWGMRAGEGGEPNPPCTTVDCTCSDCVTGGCASCSRGVDLFTLVACPLPTDSFRVLCGWLLPDTPITTLLRVRTDLISSS